MNVCLIWKSVVINYSPVQVRIDALKQGMLQGAVAALNNIATVIGTAAFAALFGVGQVLL